MRLIIIFLLFPISILCQKMNGVNLVSSQVQLDSNTFSSLARISADHVCFTPYAWMNQGEPEIYTEYESMWWGDKKNNLQKMVSNAREQNLTIMLKPHFWVENVGWAGELVFDEKNWRVWEKNYLEFVVNHANFCEENAIKYFCFGVELKTAVQARPKFFDQLIDTIRTHYSGKVLYAANWDNFENVSFWNKLDYIGIDAYFPLSYSIRPSKKELKDAWKLPKCEMRKLSEQYGKQVILTEFGYRNSEFALGKQWLIDELTQDSILDNDIQELGYSVLFKELWNEDYIAGGFLWKWWIYDESRNALKNDYSPQHKPVETVINKWYSK